MGQEELKTKRDRLADAFNDALDIDRVLLFVQGTSRLTPIGEGLHFRVFKLQGRLGQMDLAVGIAKDEFLRELGPAGLQRWIANLQKVGSSGVLLAPPIEVIKTEEKLVVVSPLGKPDLGLIDQCWFDLEGIKESDREALSALGLKLDDIWQIRVCYGVPFICDWSDLRPT